MICQSGFVSADICMLATSRPMVQKVALAEDQQQEICSCFAHAFAAGGRDLGDIFSYVLHTVESRY